FAYDARSTSIENVVIASSLVLKKSCSAIAAYVGCGRSAGDPPTTPPMTPPATPPTTPPSTPLFGALAYSYRGGGGGGAACGDTVDVTVMSFRSATARWR